MEAEPSGESTGDGQDKVAVNIEEMETVDESQNDKEEAAEPKTNGDAEENGFTVDIKVENKRKYLNAEIS